MPTEKEIEAALAAWDSIPRHKDLDGRQRMRSEGSKFSYPVFPDSWPATKTSNQF